MTISRYAEERIGYVQSIVRRLGVPVSKSSYFERFMGACLRAELEYLTVFFDREGGRMEEAPHPDTIKGKWRKAAEQLREQRAISLGIDIAKSKKAGKTLTDCFEKWKLDRQQANKKTTRHGADEKELAIEDFQKHARVRDIGEITRAQIVAFRDHLFTTGLKTPTVNKRVGQITTLLATAQRAGWIDTAITGGIYIEIPAGTNEREPFDRAELDFVFVHDVAQDFYGDEWLAMFESARLGAFRALDRLRDEGVIVGWGLGVNRVEPIEIVMELDEPRPDIFLLAGRYTLLDHDKALQRMMPMAAERGLRIVVGGPYSSGALVGGPNFEYAPATPAVLDKVARIKAIADEHGVGMKAAGLQFPLAHPAVAAVIPGASRPSRIVEDRAAMDEIIPVEFWRRLRDAGLIGPAAPTPAAQ